MDANPFTEIYGKVRVADTLDFVIKYKKTYMAVVFTLSYIRVHGLTTTKYN